MSVIFGILRFDGGAVSGRDLQRQRMAKSIEPQLLAEIVRMEKSETLSRMIDFAKIRTLLAARGPDDHNSGWEQETQLALGGFVTARYVEWLRRDNA